jgi:signal transduction histidine kinase
MDQVNVLARLLEVTRNLSASVELGKYIESIFSAAVELTDSDTAAILEYDEATQEFYYRFVPWFHRDAVNNVRIPLNETVAGWVFLQVKPAVINDVNDVKNDTEYYGKLNGFPSTNTHSMLSVPLILRGKPVGVFQVFNKTFGVKYTPEDTLLIETLASLASMAIQNDMLENNIQSSEEESRELDRLKNEFIAITSHELRTPLGLILGHSTFLRELVGNEYREQVDAIIRNASRLKEIIESLSNVDNYQTGMSSLRQRRVSMARVIEDVLSSFREMATQKNVTLKAEVPSGDLLFLDVDSAKLTIVVSNLVKNAIAFSNEGGHVNVRAERQTDYIKVAVEDDGVGIPARDLPRIFERFYQVESHLTRKHGGMGLGLSVAKVMIEMHGGRIWAESMEGVGSTFIFLLPNKVRGEVPTEPVKPFAQ